MLPGWPVDMANSLRAIGMSFNPRVQNQRGALTMVGDQAVRALRRSLCGVRRQYHGWVVGLRLDRPAAFGAWRTSASGGGIWAPGGIAFDGRHLFAATGFSRRMTDWSGGEAVIRLPLDLTLASLRRRISLRRPTGLEPRPRHEQSAADRPAGRRPRCGAAARARRDGNAYLLDRADLGGIDHPLDAQKVAVTAVMTSRLPPIASGRDMLVAFQVGGSVAPAAMQDDRRDGAAHFGRAATVDAHGVVRQAGRTGSRRSSPRATIRPTRSSGSSAPRATKSCTVSAATAGRRYSRAIRSPAFGIS